MSNEEYNPYRADLAGDREAPVAEKPARKSRGGCFLYGCLFSILGVIILGIAVTVGGYYFFKGQITKYTDVDPIAMPEVEMSDEEMAAVVDRLQKFQEIVFTGTEEETPETVELILTADDINAMIEQNPDFKGHVHVEIEENQLAGQVSIPTDFLPIGQGRFFNATAKFDVMLNNGVLFVTLADATIKGNPLPQPFLDGLRSENLVKNLNTDPKYAGTIRQLESLKIESGKIILIAKPKTTSDQEADEKAATREDFIREGVKKIEEAQATSDSELETVQ